MNKYIVLYVIVHQIHAKCNSLCLCSFEIELYLRPIFNAGLFVVLVNGGMIGGVDFLLLRRL